MIRTNGLWAIAGMTATARTSRARTIPPVPIDFTSVRAPSLHLFEQQIDRPHGNRHAHADLYRQLPPVVGEPHVQMRRPLVEHSVEQVDFVADGLERAKGSLHVLALLRLYLHHRAFLAVADRLVYGLAGLQIEGPQEIQAA